MTYSLGYDIAEPPTLTMAPSPADLASPDTRAAASQGDLYAGQEGPTFDALSAHYVATRDAQIYAGNSNSEAMAARDATQAQLDRIRAATGVTVNNPFLAPPLTGTEMDDPNAAPEDRATLAAYAADHPDYRPGQLLDAQAQIDAAPYRANAFSQRLQDLARQFPDQAGVINPVGPGYFGPEAGAVLARASLANEGALPGAGLGGFLASMAGGMSGMMRDPIQQAAMFVGGGEIGAVSRVGAIAETALRQGALAAGAQALSEPGVQAWRDQIGVDHGFTPAAEDVGWAALLGAIPGGALGAFHHLAPRVDPATLRDAITAAQAGDPAAAETIGKVAPADAMPAVHAAIDAARLDREALPPVPPGARPGDLDALYGDALARAEDPSAPLPEPATLARKGITDARARDALAGLEGDGATWPRAVDTLRADPALVESALASQRPDLVMLGRLASLDDTALSLVRAGDARPEFAQHVAAITADPSAQIELIGRLKRWAPASEDAARQVISDSLEIRNSRAIQGAILRPDPPPAMTEPRRVATSRPRPQTLVAFLRSAGGLRDEGGDLKSLGFGKTRAARGLINPNGLSLDHAREIAAEAGYLGANTDHAMSETTIADLIDALDGGDRYSVHDEEAVVAANARRASEARQARLAMSDAQARRAVVKAVGGDAGDLDPLILARAADHLAEGNETDPVAAWDRAALDSERDLMDTSAAFEAGHHGDRIPFDDPPFDDIPFDDAGIPADAGGTPGAGDAAARGGGGEPGDGALQERGGGSPRGDGEGDRGDRGASPGEKPDLIALTPLSDFANGADTRMLTREDLARVGDHEDILARFVEDCAL